MQKTSRKTLFVFGIILFVAISRLLPHLPNFTPLAAIALFGGAFLLNKKMAYFFTFAALLLSDILVNIILYNDTNFLNYIIQPYVWAVYFSFGLTVFIGTTMQNNVSIKNVAKLTVSSSLLFWIITNFACWPNNPLYTQDFAGLLNCYVAALPYLGNVVGDLFYATLLFGIFYVANKRIPALAKA